MDSGSVPALRLATVADIPQILMFWVAAAENDGRPDDDAESVARLIQRDPDSLILVEADAAIVGSLVRGWDGWRFHLYRLAVHPDWRRRGIGRMLLAESERRCAAVGAKRLDAMVLGANRTGVQFWESVGYREQDEWRRWVKPVDE